jgi:ribonuclease BN (tRNA processing enzyme)
MQSTLIFLGTGGDSFTVGRQTHGSGGFIIFNDDVKLHIDPGPGTLNRIKAAGLSPRDTTAIVCTHKHIGHCNDLNAYIDAMTHSGLDKKGVVLASESVINGTADEHAYLTEFHKSCVERAIVLTPGSKIGIEDFEVIATGTLHADQTGIGLVIQAPDATIGYTSDTQYSNDIAKQYEGCDILILNVPYPFGVNKQECVNGLCADDVIKILEKVRPKLAIMTHFGIKMVKSDIIDITREIQKTTGVQTIFAKEGMGLIPSNYAARSEQKRLTSFD